MDWGYSGGYRIKSFLHVRAESLNYWGLLFLAGLEISGKAPERIQNF
ncbi:MAG: hypothetical protein JWO92_2057 [Chitinophagaceae bacterium]|nr:hypothetical protein [Chitinophagaceae bacterium]MDB5223869.1 hypothetical protein [Chitinophagaceae bacterium]